MEKIRDLKQTEIFSLEGKLEEKKTEGVTFKINDTVLKQAPNNVGDALKQIITSNQIMKNYDGRILLCTTNKPNTFQPEIINGFVSALVSAYNNHYNLILRPDDVWIAITS